MKPFIPILLCMFFAGPAFGQFATSAAFNDMSTVFEKVDKQLWAICRSLKIERKDHVKTMHCSPGDAVYPQERLYIYNLGVILKDIIEVLTILNEKKASMTIEFKKPKCVKCEEEGKSYIIQKGWTSGTAADCPPFWDETGKYHNHDCNSYETQYNCNNGHHWIEKSPRHKCWCGWPEETTK